jgi:hypothetical protein
VIYNGQVNYARCSSLRTETLRVVVDLLVYKLRRILQAWSGSDSSLAQSVRTIVWAVFAIVAFNTLANVTVAIIHCSLGKAA